MYAFAYVCMYVYIIYVYCIYVCVITYNNVCTLYYETKGFKRYIRPNIK